jgi:hypothetical protein
MFEEVCLHTPMQAPTGEVAPVKGAEPLSLTAVSETPLSVQSESSLFGSFSLSQERKRKRTSGLNVTII